MTWGVSEQGLNAREELLDRHPFYSRDAFNVATFEAWRTAEAKVPPARAHEDPDATPTGAGGAGGRRRGGGAAAAG